ncbi:YitT family protein [Blautia sp. HCP3S3_C4]|uniref:YitT family protein n=1 Tax=Blautia sp. HCP3S3_C4 TaxID=3438911 RepID=UPI003F897A64
MNSKKSSMQGRKPLWLEYLMIIVGTGLMSLAINSVFDASGMVTGGFSGIAIIIKAWTKGLVNGGIPLWVTNCVLNIPLFFIAWRVKGFSFIKKAILGEISLSVWLAIQPVFHLAGDDLLLAALYGGVIQGVGIGLVFLGGGTTGGTDMMAAIIQKFLQHYSISQIMQIIDGAVVVVGMYVFGIHKALYAIIAVYLVTKVSDGLIEGLKFSKAVYIITEKPEEIAGIIMEDLDRGATGINVKGMYSGQDKLMLFVVVNKKEIVMLKEKVDEIDPQAFVIVTDAREVHGEGFIEKNR